VFSDFESPKLRDDKDYMTQTPVKTAFPTSKGTGLGHRNKPETYMGGFFAPFSQTDIIFRTAHFWKFWNLTVVC
jgi:hypothetical protein